MTSMQFEKPLVDDIELEPISSDMDNEPDLDDDDFALSTTQKTSYEYFPETKEELKKIIRMEIEKQGGVDVNLNMIDTSKITDMSFMFDEYTSLQTLDISGWNVSNVEDMRYMFYGCTSLGTHHQGQWESHPYPHLATHLKYCIIFSFSCF